MSASTQSISGHDVFPDDLDSRLLSACLSDGQADKADLVLDLLNHGADPNAFSGEGESALYLAAVSGSAEVVRLLLHSGAHVDIELKEGERTTPLQAAASVGHLVAVDVIDALLGAGAQVNIADVNGWAALHHAVHSNCLEAIQVLLQHGADLEAKNKLLQTPLSIAAINDHTEAARLLAERGANLEVHSAMGWTPLHWTAVLNSVSTAIELLKQGCDSESLSANEETALKLAVDRGHFETALALIAHGANASTLKEIRFRDLPQIHAAARGGFTQRLLELIGSGAEPDALHRHMTAADEAERAGQTETLSALQAWKARRAIDDMMCMGVVCDAMKGDPVVSSDADLKSGKRP